MNKTILSELLSHVTREPEHFTEKLIGYFGTVSAVIEAGVDEIARALDGDESTALYIKLAVAIASRRFSEGLTAGKKYTDKEMEIFLPAYFYGVSVEIIAIISVDGAGKVISIDKASEGTVNFSTVTSRKILEIAKRRKARGVIIAHNHPGGYAVPSDEDVASARLLYEVLSISGVKLIDSFVVAGAEFSRIEI